MQRSGGQTKGSGMTSSGLPAKPGGGTCAAPVRALKPRQSFARQQVPLRSKQNVAMERADCGLHARNGGRGRPKQQNLVRPDTQRAGIASLRNIVRNDAAVRLRSSGDDIPRVKALSHSQRRREAHHRKGCRGLEWVVVSTSRARVPAVLPPPSATRVGNQSLCAASPGQEFDVSTSVHRQNAVPTLCASARE